MRHRPDREDLTAQRDNLAAARARLHEALRGVEYRAKDAARVAGSKAKNPPPVDLTAFHAARVAVERAEADVDHAARDLASASGQDV